MTDLRDRIAEVLAGHRALNLGGRTVICSCGWSTDATLDAALAEHDAHVAEAILAAIGAPIQADAFTMAANALAEPIVSHEGPIASIAQIGLDIAVKTLRALAEEATKIAEDPRRALTEEAE